MSLKHRGNSKIKLEHHMIDGLKRVLEDLQKIPEIHSIIPGRIRSGAASDAFQLRVQYQTPSGLKCSAISGGAVQEVFIVTDSVERVRTELERYNRKNEFKNN